MVEIEKFETKHQTGVSDLILFIQREEFGIPISAQDQPDLYAIPDFYQLGCGDFLVAVSGESVVGTIGLKDIGNGASSTAEDVRIATFSRTGESSGKQVAPATLDGGRAVRCVGSFPGYD